MCIPKQLHVVFFSFFLKGVLCPTGCELQTALVKQERTVKPTIADLDKKIRDLERSSATFYEFTNQLDQRLVKRQKQIKGNHCLCPVLGFIVKDSPRKGINTEHCEVGPFT